MLWKVVSQVLFLDDHPSMPSNFGARESYLKTHLSEVAAGEGYLFSLVFSYL